MRKVAQFPVRVFFLPPRRTQNCLLSLSWVVPFNHRRRISLHVLILRNIRSSICLAVTIRKTRGSCFCVRTFELFLLIEKIMGSVCCVAVKDRKVPPPPSSSGSGLTPHAAGSPQCSFRRDNRRHVADEVEGSPYHSPYVVSRGISLDKMSLGSVSEGRGGTPPLDGSLGTPVSQKAAAPEMGTNSMTPPSSDSSSAFTGASAV